MRSWIRAAAAAALLVMAPAVAAAHGHETRDLRIDHPWTPPPPPGAPVAAGYLTVTNTGRAADRLLGAESPAFDRIEIHDMSMDGGVMRMRPLPDGVALPPGGAVRFEPGSMHFMLIGPKRTLRAGDRVPATLVFRRAGRVRIAFRVESRAAEGAQGASDSHAAMPHMDMH